MGHSFMENTQSGQIPKGRGTFIPNRALTVKLVLTLKLVCNIVSKCIEIALVNEYNYENFLARSLRSLVYILNLL